VTAVPIVHYWAAAREAAGVSSEELPAATLAELARLAGRRHGPRLERVLGHCSWVVDGQTVRPGEGGPGLRPDSVVEALPPFAGG
jgi:hypothetical protein